MSIIYSYPETTSVTDSDLFILSKHGTNKDTNTVKAENIKNYVIANSAGSWLTKEITITAAQLKDLVANPVEVLPAPGQDKSYNIIQLAWYMEYGTVAFNFSLDADGAPKLAYSDPTIAAQTYSIGDRYDFNSTSSYVSLNNISYNTSPGYSPPGAIGANVALLLIAGENAAGTPTDATTGDGTLYLSIAYKVLDISSSIKAY